MAGIIALEEALLEVLHYITSRGLSGGSQGRFP